MKELISHRLDALLSIPYRLLGGREEFWRIFRYLLIGGWNTAFGIGSYALLVCFPWGREHYLIMLVPGNILAITNAFLCYKLFVFRTKGGWLREYFRCYAVYAGGIALGFALMYLFVGVFGLHPILAQATCMVITTILSYIGHSRFSFRKPQPLSPEVCEPRNDLPK